MKTSSKNGLATNKRQRYLVIGLMGIAGLLLIGYAARSLRQDAGPDEPVTNEQSAVVQITAEGFVPATLQIDPGTTVTWVNADTEPHRVASNPHPDHSDLEGLDSAENIDAEASYSFTFEEAGTFDYHDHLAPTTNGTVVVE